MRKISGDYPLLIPGLHSGQALIKSELKKRNIICAHRGWRKSSFGIHMVIEHLLTGQNAGWYAPTFNVVVGANWVDFNRAGFGNTDWFNKTENTWTIPGHGTCYFFSMDRPGTARGGTFSLGIAEELGEWGQGIYESVFEPIVQKVDGTIIAFGTPNNTNPHNDFETILERCIDYPETHNGYHIPAWGAELVDGELVQGLAKDTKYMCTEGIFPTWQSVVDSYRRSINKSKWRVEYLCKFESSQGSMFAGVNEVCTLKPELVYA